jgi:hypothetical protein
MLQDAIPLGFEDGVFSGAGRRDKIISSRAADKHFGAVYPGFRTSEKRGKTASVLTLIPYPKLFTAEWSGPRKRSAARL